MADKRTNRDEVKECKKLRLLQSKDEGGLPQSPPPTPPAPADKIFRHFSPPKQSFLVEGGGGGGVLFTFLFVRLAAIKYNNIDLVYGPKGNS